MKPIEKQADLSLRQCTTKFRLDQLGLFVAHPYSFRLCTSNCGEYPSKVFHHFSFYQITIDKYFGVLLAIRYMSKMMFTMPSLRRSTS